jgi:hypothetical protein
MLRRKCEDLGNEVAATVFHRPIDLFGKSTNDAEEGFESILTTVESDDDVHMCQFESLTFLLIRPKN